MEAPLARSLSTSTSKSAAALWILAISAASPSLGAGFRTANFTVDASTPELAREIGEAAEAWRSRLAVAWLGEELPDWSQPCPIKARVAPGLGAGGATSFVFDGGQVFGWRMNIQGSRERILDSVLPHEVTHTIFASHFRQPLPRWADEGACTTVEHQSEISKQERMLIEFLHTRRGIAFSDMFAMKEYPSDVLPLYAQGHALAELLIGQRGKPAFLEFLRDGMGDENWPRAVREHYGFENLLALQNSWLDWIRAGRPDIAPRGAALASAKPRGGTSAVRLASAEITEPLVYRGQDPDERGWSPRRSAQQSRALRESATSVRLAATGVTSAMPRTGGSSPYVADSSPVGGTSAGTSSGREELVTSPWSAVSPTEGVSTARRDTRNARR